MKKTIIALGFLIIILSTVSVFAQSSAQDNFDINSTQLPYNDSAQLVITAPENSTVNIHLINQTQGFENISYTETIYLNSVSTGTVDINFKIKNRSLQNKEVEKAYFKINNTGNNQSVTYLINVTINPVLFVEETRANILLENGEYILNFSKTLLPMTGDLLFSVDSDKNTVINLTCSTDWLKCPENKTIINGSNNLEIEYLVPKNTSLGVYNETIQFTSNNGTTTAKITIHITDDLPILKSFVWRDECITNNGTIEMSCWEEYEEFSVTRLKQIYESALKEAKDDICDEPETITEYVVTGDLKKSTVDAWNNCENDKNKANSKLLSCTNNVEDITTKYNDCQTKLLSNQTELVNACYASTNKIKATSEEEKKKIIRIYWTYIIITFVLIILATLYVMLRRKKETDTSFIYDD